MCYDDWALVVNIFVAIGTIGAVVVVIYKDFFIAWRNRPIINCELENPSVYSTKLKNESGLVQKKFCRLVIRNTGKTSLKNVEVMITDLKIQEGDQFIRVDYFSPDNLIWSSIGQDRSNYFDNTREHWGNQIYCPFISPYTSQLCILGNIIGDIIKMTQIEKYGNKIFELNVRFKSNILYYLLKSGKYHTEITVGAENANALKKCFEMNITETEFEIKEIRYKIFLNGANESETNCGAPTSLAPFGGKGPRDRGL
jgi:hypothetical protein